MPRPARNEGDSFPVLEWLEAIVKGAILLGLLLWALLRADGGNSRRRPARPD